MQDKNKIIWVVYLITREDNQKYIGKTNYNRIDNRMSVHKNSDRFKGLNFSYEILFESTSHDVILQKEEYFIELYDTYKNGLNYTKSGAGCGHNSPKFTTLNFEFSDESKNKMRDSALKRVQRDGISKFQNKETRKKTAQTFSKNNKGKFFNKLTFDKETIENIRYFYENKLIFFTEDYIKEIVKITDIKNVGVKPLHQLKSKNGRFLSYKRLFEIHLSKIYQISTTHIKNIIENKCYRHDIEYRQFL